MRARYGDAAGQTMRACFAITDITSCNGCVVSCDPLNRTYIQFTTHVCRTAVLGKAPDELQPLDSSRGLSRV